MIEKLAMLSSFFGRTFSVWVILIAALAYIQPDWFKFLGPYISILLGIVMFGMGLTLTLKDFSEVVRQPWLVLLGLVCQFSLMPVLAYLLCIALNLPKEIAVGVILVGCCPGGTSSNVMTYLAKGDVPLSVTLSACSTLLAPVVTPALIYLFASQWVDVDAWGMFKSIVNIVILPIAGGILVHYLFKKQVKASISIVPLISVFGIVAIVATVVALSKEQIAKTGVLIFSVVIMHNLLGLMFGYLVARLFRLSVSKQKTLSIEVGLQNSGLGVALANTFFNPVAAVPAALFSVWHNISGSLAAMLFLKLKDKEAVPQTE